MTTPLNRITALVRRKFLALATLVALAGTASAQVPTMISYQGRVQMNNTNFGGTGQFKFALVRAAGPTLLWKNDASAGNTEPTSAVSLSVANGLVMTALGDTTLANMTALPISAFENYPDVRLRVWFNGGAGFQQLTPDQRIVSVGYALMAGTVQDGSITTAKLAPGVLTPGNFPANSVSSTQLGDSIDLGANGVSGHLDIFSTPLGGPAWSIDGAANLLQLFGDDGLENARLWGPGYGELVLRNSLANNAAAVTLTAQGSTGGRLSLNNTNGSGRAILEGENTGGLLTLYTADGNTGAVLYGNEGAGSGALSLRNTNGSSRFRAYGGPLDGSLELYSELGRLTFAAEGGEGNTGSQLNMYQSNGVRSVQIDAENGINGGGYAAVYSGDGGAATISAANSQGGTFSVYEEDGTLTTIIHNVSDAGVVSVRNSSGVETGYLWGRNSAGQTGGQIGLKNSAGSQTITLNASDANGDGRITTQVLQITGGSDLSENFDVNAEKDELQSGMIVSIDSKNPGELVLAREAYDAKVAGILSGAGGVKPGMLMGQKGTKADGKHPVALTGRVYCHVDASHGAIEPGDMITTSTTPGHGMKATNRERAFGSIIGKAMTGLAEGKGLVLVLVNLQ